MHTNIIGISSIRNGFNNFFTSIGFHFNSKIVVGNHEM